MTVAASSASSSLALIDRARVALSEARTIEDAKDVRDKAATLAYYAARKDGAEEAERYANEIRLRAERRIGELSREMEKASAGRKPKEMEPTKGVISKHAALEKAGIAQQDASRFERIAAIPEKRFEAEVVKPEATTRALARIGGEYRTPRRREEPVRVTRPSVSQRIIEQRAMSFRAAIEKVVKKHLSTWPSDAPRAPLSDVLVSIASTIQEE